MTEPRTTYNIHLSAKARNVYEFICRHKAAHDGNSPNLREIAIGAGLATTSTATVRAHLLRLERAGLIRLPGVGSARGIEVVGGKWTMPERTPPYRVGISIDEVRERVAQQPPLLNGRGGGVYSVGVVE